MPLRRLASNAELSTKWGNVRSGSPPMLSCPQNGATSPDAQRVRNQRSESRPGCIASLVLSAAKIGPTSSGVRLIGADLNVLPMMMSANLSTREYSGEGDRSFGANVTDDFG